MSTATILQKAAADVRAWKDSHRIANLRIFELEQTLDEIEWLCDGREDIDNNGGPNLAMQIMTAIRGIKP